MAVEHFLEHTNTYMHLQLSWTGSDGKHKWTVSTIKLSFLLIYAAVFINIWGKGIDALLIVLFLTAAL